MKMNDSKEQILERQEKINRLLTELQDVRSQLTKVLGNARNMASVITAVDIHLERAEILIAHQYPHIFEETEVPI